MADQKVSARTETTAPTGGYYHVIRDEGGGVDSYKISSTNALKPVQDQIDAIPTWTDITGVGLTAGNNAVDTGQSAIEPEDIKIIDPDNNNIDISKEFTIGHTSSGNWFINIYSSIARPVGGGSGLTVKWFGVILLMFLFSNSKGQDLESVLNGWANAGKYNFLDSVKIQDAAANGIPYFSSELLETQSTFSFDGTNQTIPISGEYRIGNSLVGIDKTNDHIRLFPSVEADTFWLNTTNFIRMHSNSHVLINTPTGLDFLHDVTLQNNTLFFGNLVEKLYKHTDDTLYYFDGVTDWNLLNPNSSGGTGVDVSTLNDSALTFVNLIGDSLETVALLNYSKVNYELQVPYIESSQTIQADGGFKSGSLYGWTGNFDTYRAYDGTDNIRDRVNGSDIIEYYSDSVSMQTDLTFPDETASGVLYLGTNKEATTNSGIFVSGNTLTAPTLGGSTSVLSGGVMNAATSHGFTDDATTYISSTGGDMLHYVSNQITMILDPKKVTVKDTLVVDGQITNGIPYLDADGVVSTSSYFKWEDDSLFYFDLPTHNINIGTELNNQGNRKLSIGYSAGQHNIGNDGVHLGYYAGRFRTGIGGVYVGRGAGVGLTTAKTDDYSVHIGYNSGAYKYGIGSIYIGRNAGAHPSATETEENNVLYIDNSNSTTPLIHGDFANDSLTINGKLTSDYYIGQLYIDSDQNITISATGIYYTVDNFTPDISEKITVVDSSFTVPAGGNGYYRISHHESIYNISNAVVHFSIFVNDVEDTRIEVERKLATAAGDVGASSGTGIIWLDNGDIVKLKVKSDNTGTLTISHANFNIQRIN